LTELIIILVLHHWSHAASNCYSYCIEVTVMTAS